MSPHSVTSLILSDRRGLQFSVPADIRSLTTFTLMEQDSWFEKEVDFVPNLVGPGMVAIDIGANLGMYTLLLARSIAQDGTVYAYEPSSAARAHLERSLALNSIRNVVVCAAAVSSAPGTASLTVDPTLELAQLARGGENSTERVSVVSLDAESDVRGWQRIDFLKIDAEGHEEAIIDGAVRLLERHLPIVMYERIHRGVPNHALTARFRALGWRIFRLLGDRSALVDVQYGEPIDAMELNLFAIGPGRIPGLVAAGLVAERGTLPSLTKGEREIAVREYCALPFARQLEIGVEDIEACPLAEALIAFAAYRFTPGISPARKLALLQDAFERMRDHAAHAPSAAALSSLAHVAAVLGQRIVARDALTQLIGLTDQSVDSPFFPPSPRFERHPTADVEAWLGQDIRETLEFLRHYSSINGANLPEIETLAESDLASAELLKRLALARVLSGARAEAIAPVLARLAEMEGRPAASWAAKLRVLAGARR